MKKICYITTVPGTIRAFILESARYIHENTDWDISFICSYDENFEIELPEYIHYFPVNMQRGIDLRGMKAIVEMKKIFDREKFDLIQYSTPNASLYAALAGKMANIPVRLYCQWGMAFVGFSGIKRWVFKQEEKLVCKLSTWIEPDSKSNLKFSHIQKLYSKEKSSVIWNGSASGIDLRKFDITQKDKFRKKIREKYRISDDTFIYGFVGRVTRDKGINELLAAFKKLLLQKQNVVLMIIGKNEMNGTINKELYQWSIKNNHVIYTGSTNVVEEYLGAMDCFVLPSYREGFGSVVIEAEAMGVPVIVTDIPGPIDAMINNETGLIVKKADVESLYNAMKKLGSERETCLKFGEKAHEYAKRNFEQNKVFQYILEDRKRLIRN